MQWPKKGIREQKQLEWNDKGNDTGQQHKPYIQVINLCSSHYVVSITKIGNDNKDRD